MDEVGCLKNCTNSSDFDPTSSILIFRRGSNLIACAEKYQTTFLHELRDEVSSGNGSLDHSGVASLIYYGGPDPDQPIKFDILPLDARVQKNSTALHNTNLSKKISSLFICSMCKIYDSAVNSDCGDQKVMTCESIQEFTQHARNIHEINTEGSEFSDSDHLIIVPLSTKTVHGDKKTSEASIFRLEPTNRGHTAEPSSWPCDALINLGPSNGDKAGKTSPKSSALDQSIFSKKSADHIDTSASAVNICDTLPVENQLAASNLSSSCANYGRQEIVIDCGSNDHKKCKNSNDKKANSAFSANFATQSESLELEVSKSAETDQIDKSTPIVNSAPVIQNLQTISSAEIEKSVTQSTEQLAFGRLREPFNPAITLMMASKQSISNFLQNSLINPSTSSSIDLLLNQAATSSIAGDSQQNLHHTQRCALHPDGKSSGVECPKCDVVLGSSRSLGGHITMMHSRNSCKTLKCPKCNWHYKYQETLEIHMNEKHNDTAPTACVYCASNASHPRLGRGEQWSCGYKPYRCEVCKYSTTTKGNLAIHMQSDKHLNNVQEIQQSGAGKLLCPVTFAPVLGSSTSSPSVNNTNNGNPSPLPPGPTSSAMALLQLAQSCANSQRTAPPSPRPSNQSKTPLNLSTAESRKHEPFPSSNFSTDSNNVGNKADSFPGSSFGSVIATDSTSSALPSFGSRPQSSNKPKSVWRCDVCNYETNVARNLRIHMTSEKHTQNMQSMQNGTSAARNAVIGLITTQHPRSIGTASSSITSAQSFATSLTSSAKFTSTSNSNDRQSAITCQQLASGRVGHGPNDLDVEQRQSAQLAASMQTYLLEVGANTGQSFQCCVCMSFVCHTLVELIDHQQRTDRGRPNESDVALVNGNYLCNLCHYKTHLKANFQLHTKTDKHLQRLQLVNHVREGGFRNELRVKYLNPNNPVQLRCIACNEFSNSLHKLQMHLTTNRHKICQASYEKICSVDCGADSTSFFDTNHCFHCSLCDYASAEKQSMIAHLHSERHADMLTQILAITETQEGDLSGFNLNWINVRNDADQFLIGDDSTGDTSDNERESEEEFDEKISTAKICESSKPNAMKDEARTTNQNPPQCDIQCDRNSSNGNSKCRLSPDREKCNDVAVNSHFVCPLCQTACGPHRDHLEVHLSQMHKVPADGVRRLLDLLPPSPPAKIAADTENSTAAVTTTTAPFSCWSRGCAATFASLPALRTHQHRAHLSSRVVVGKHNDATAPTTSAAEVTSAAPKKLTSLASQRCDTCGRLFRTRASLARHVEKMHAATTSAVALAAPNLTLSLNGAVSESTLNGAVTNDDGEERLNTASMAELHYADPDRPFRCDRCKMAFTKQVFLSVHNRTLQHRQRQQPSVTGVPPAQQFATRPQFTATNNGGNLVSPTNVCNTVEKYNDPCRPFKCDVCKESFTQKNILLVHYNSVSHLNKLKKSTGLTSNKTPGNNGNNGNSLNFTPPMLSNTPREQSTIYVKNAGANHSNNGRTDSTAISQQCDVIDSVASVDSSESSTPSSIDGANVAMVPEAASSKIFKCNACKVSYGSGATLDVHLRSVAHLTRSQKLYELYATGELKPSTPLVERPDVKPHFWQGARNGPHSQLVGDDGAVFSPMSQLGKTSGNGLNVSILDGGDASAKNQGDTEPEGWGVQNGSTTHHAKQHFPKGGVLKKLLENYGFEVVMQYNEGHNRKRRKSTSDIDEQQGNGKVGRDDEMTGGGGSETELKKIKLEKIKQKLSDSSKHPPLDIPELSKCKCCHCDKQFSSLWVLKAHVEQVHKQIVPAGEVEKVSETFKQAFDSKCTITTKLGNDEFVCESASPVTTTLSPSVAPSQKLQSDVTNFSSSTASMPQTSQSQAAAMAAAAVNMSLANLGLQYPFMGLPFGPFGLQNPFLPMMMPAPGTVFDPLAFSQASQQMVHHFGAPPVSCGAPSSTATPPVATNQTASARANLQNLHNLSLQQQQQQDQPKRARTRINDDQLNVLKQYFDINNSPTEEQIDEMSQKACLPHKVIKHWFRNTLFKERQRSKDSPYNFNIPPSMGIDLEEYEKTGEARIIAIDYKGTAVGTPSTEKDAEDDEDVLPKNLKICEEGIAEKTEDLSKSDLDPVQIVECESKGDTKEDSSLLTCDEEDTYEDDYEPCGTEILNGKNRDTALTPQEQLMQLAASSMSGLSMNFSNFTGIPVSQNLSPINQISKFTPQPGLLSPVIPSSSSSAVADYGSTLNVNLSPNSSTFNSSLVGYGSAPGAYGSASAGSMFTTAGFSASSILNQSQTAAGRRANRTRFTEWQVKILQDFFESNAYPKDDDLECLSSKLSLSPRVIVVWFQNMRQKARKIYENNPPNTAITANTVESMDENMFVKTPGLNYQCKKCSLVFQRYYELIKHQKTVCYKDDVTFNSKMAGFSQLATPQKFDESVKLEPMCGEGSAEPMQKSEIWQQNDAKVDILDKMPQIGQSNVKPVQLETTNAQLLYKQFEMLSQTFNKGHSVVPSPVSPIDSKTSQLNAEIFNKKCCPFCALPTPSQQAFEAHLAAKHGTQCSTLNFKPPNLDDLHDEKVVTISSTSSSFNLNKIEKINASVNVQEFIDQLLHQTSTSTQPAHVNQGSDEGPLDLSRAMPCKQQAVKNFISGSHDDTHRAPSENNSYNDDDVSFASFDENSFYADDETPPLSPNSSAVPRPHPANSQRTSLSAPQGGQRTNSASATGRRPHKRFRTRLSPQQIRVMKCLFKDFKTPTMSECEALGNEMCLHKRVVQVWFQNARAKERKGRSTSGLSISDDSSCPVVVDRKNLPSKCDLCNFPVSGRANLQDHAFTKHHIENVRRTVEHACDGDDDDNGSGSTHDGDTASPTPSSSRSVADDRRRPAFDLPTSWTADGFRTSKSIGTPATTNRSAAPQNPSNSSFRSSASNKTGVEESKNGDGGAVGVLGAGSDLMLPSTTTTSANFLPYFYAAAAAAAAANNPTAALYASMMLPTPGLNGIPNGNLYYDPNLYGTPVNLLQVPQSVMQNILSTMQRNSKEQFCRFTQDGKSLAELLNCLADPSSRSCAGEKEFEVGWACRTCNTVFQAENLFSTHQQLVCQSKDRAFKLVQIHYECKKCKQCYGTQVEFVAHCDSVEHKSKL